MSFILTICEFLIASIYYFYNQEKRCFEVLKFSVTILKEKFEGKYLQVFYLNKTIIMAIKMMGTMVLIMKGSYSITVFTEEEAAKVYICR